MRFAHAQNFSTFRKIRNKKGSAVFFDCATQTNAQPTAESNMNSQNLFLAVRRKRYASKYQVYTREHSQKPDSVRKIEENERT